MASDKGGDVNSKVEGSGDQLDFHLKRAHSEPMFKDTARILIVDDMEMVRSLAVQACRNLGFKDVIEAPDGYRAWDYLMMSDPPVELVISDWNMPGLTGIELLKRIREHEKFKGLPFILLTAEAETGQVTTAIKLGADNYLLKPFTANDLRRKIEETYKRAAKRNNWPS